ncbi:MAG: hypothetical protein IJY46_08490, partial [Lentisphaeria bacterium]|nr:hypothetical protein [Lentisphaeria bacterium]
SGFLPAGLPSFPVPRRAQRLLVFSFDYSACVQPIASASLAAYCSASSARAEFLQRVRRLLTGGSLRPGARAKAPTASHHYSKTRFFPIPFLKKAKYKAPQVVFLRNGSNYFVKMFSSAGNTPFFTSSQ